MKRIYIPTEEEMSPRIYGTNPFSWLLSPQARIEIEWKRFYADLMRVVMGPSIQ